MAKISTYPSADTPLLLSDRLIGTEAIRVPPSPIPLATKNFSLGELLNLFSVNFPASSLQEVLDMGNSATQDIYLTGRIESTVIKPVNIEDSTGSQGTVFQYLSKGASSISWVTLPVDNLQAVLNSGNNATQNITLVGNITSTLMIPGNIKDETSNLGSIGQVLTKSTSGIVWSNLPISTVPSLGEVLATGNTAINDINLTGNMYATTFVKSGGTSSQFLKADGSIDSSSYAPISLIPTLTSNLTNDGDDGINPFISLADVPAQVNSDWNATSGVAEILNKPIIPAQYNPTAGTAISITGAYPNQTITNTAPDQTVALTAGTGIAVTGTYPNFTITNNAPSGGTVTAVTATAPMSSTGGTAPNLSMTSANGTTNGYLLSSDWLIFNGKFNTPSGTTLQYVRGDGSLATFPVIPAQYNPSAGTGISITGAYPNQTITNTAPDQVVALTAGTGIGVAGTYPNFTISNSDPTSGVTLSSAGGTESLVNDGTGPSLATKGLTAGTGISLSGTTTAVTVTNSAPDQTVALTAGTGIGVTGTYPNFTITNSSPSSGGTVTSVGLTMPSAFSVANSPVTTSGTLTVTGAGTISEYVRGDGSLATLPSLTGYVPYTGATADVDLGTHNLTADHLALNVNPSGAGYVVGATRWNNTIGSSETLLKGGSVSLKNGVDLVARVVNKVTPNTTLTKAAYQAVRVSGAQGQRLAVAFAQANNDNNSADTIGLVCETIATNQEGFIQTVGQLEDINTTGSLQGETWIDGDVLYLSPTIPGALTNIKPTGATGHIVVMGYVEYSHASSGKIYVKIMNGWELDELHNVYITSPVNNDGLFYESSTSLWKNKTIATALGYTPVPTTRSLTINGTTQDLSADRTFSVGTVTSVSALTLGTTGTDLSSTVANGTTTPVITLNVPDASATNRGALTAANWTTFNGKQDALTLTTTGTSGAATLVGATLNIPQYSGGGASGGANTPVKLGSGGIYSNIPIGASATSSSLNANAMYLAPFIPAQTFTISDFKINVTLLGTGNYRILLYSHSDTNGLPDVLLYESSDLSVLTTGVKTATTTQTFTAGTTYWLGVYGSSTAQFAGVVIASQNQIGMDSTLTQYTNIFRSATFGSAPNPFGTTHTKTANTFTRIGLTVA